MRCRRLPTTRPPPERPPGPTSHRKKCAIWTRWRPEARAERAEAEVAALKEKVAELRERNGKLEGENKVLREHSERLFAMLEARPKQ